VLNPKGEEAFRNIRSPLRCTCHLPLAWFVLAVSMSQQSPAQASGGGPIGLRQLTEVQRRAGGFDPFPPSPSRLSGSLRSFSLLSAPRKPLPPSAWFLNVGSKLRVGVLPRRLPAVHIVR